MLEPLLSASPAIILHTACAMLAILLGGYQLLAVKGTNRHRLFGWVWVVLMAVVIASSFLIAEIRDGRFSLIHILSVSTAVFLLIAIQAARPGNIRRHAWTMRSIYVLGLITAGAFTL
ncbi:MAG: DUF2306 domain-containing protein, partial [Mangrovicoccus sp.]